MTKMAAEKLYKRTGVNPSQVQVVELHDCFSANEMITYEALGLCGTNPMDQHVGTLADVMGLEAAPIPAQLFGAAGIEHMNKYGSKPIHMAKIAWKNHKHSVNNP